MSQEQDVAENQTEQPEMEAFEQSEPDLTVEADETQAAADEVPGDEPEVTIEDLQKQLVSAEKKAADNWDKALRMQAEMENLKRRTSIDLENAHKYGLEKFAKELLTVIDSLELGLQAATGDSPELLKLREGIDLTIKQFEQVFAKFNIEAIDPSGQPFNPEQHQAMSVQPSDELAPNTVMNVFQKGYMLNGRLIRPAMVIVAKAADKPADDSAKVDEQA